MLIGFASFEVVFCKSIINDHDENIIENKYDGNDKQNVNLHCEGVFQK